MALTIMPDDDGTLTVIRDGQEITISPSEDLAAIGFSLSEQHFLQGQFRYAVPGPVACPVSPRIPDHLPEEWAGT